MHPARIAAVIIAAIILLIIVLLVAFPFFLLIRIVEHNVMYGTLRTPQVKISEIYPLLKTGDLLMFVPQVCNLSNACLSHSFFSHASMLLRDGNLVYTTEAHPTGGELMPNPDVPGTDYYMKKGAASAPMLTRVKFYSGMTFVMPLSHTLDPEREQVLKNTADQLHKIGYPYPTVKQGIASMVFGCKTSTRQCFQHVAHLLDVAGLTPLNQDTPLAELGFLQVCQIISNLANCPLPDGYHYGRPIRLLYDIDMLSVA